MSKREIVFVRKSSGLIRLIGALTVMVIGANYTIADGIYNFTMWQSYETPGAFYPLCLVLGCIILAFSAWAIVFLTIAMPRTSSDYVATSRILHPAIGYTQAFMNIGVHLWIVGALAYFMAWYFGSFLIQAGIALHIDAWIALGAWMSTNVWVGIGLGILFVLWAGFTNLFGLKATKWTINLLFLVALIGGLVTAGTAIWSVMVGPEKIKQLWDATYGTGAWDEIINIAKANGWQEYTGGAWGWPGPINWKATLSATVAAAYAFWGFEYANYVAGEVSEPKKSFIWGVFGAMMLILVYYLIIAVPVLYVYGPFVSYYNFVMYGGHGVEDVTINIAQTPTLAVMLASIVAKVAPWAAIVITLTVALWVMNGLPVYMIIPSRIMFALSFDRYFPEKLAEVNEKWHTPHWAILLSIILSIICVFLTAYTPWFYMVSVITITMLRWFFGSLASLLLPKRRPDIYERIAYKVAGIPVVPLIGLLGVATMGPLFVVGFISTIADPVSIGWFVAWLLGAIILYEYYTYRNKKMGIDPSKIFKELPPT